MDTPIELEQDLLSRPSVGDVDPPLRSPSPSVPSAPIDIERGHAREASSPIEEATFRVLESGRIRFFVCPRIEVDVPISIEEVQRFSFTLSPRNRECVRRLSVVAKRLPDPNLECHRRDRQAVVVEHVTGPAAIDAAARSSAAKGRGGLAPRAATGNIEVAAGTYAIASHRDHVHLLYDLELENTAVSPTLLRQLRIVPRTSYVALVPRATTRRVDAAVLDLLDHEGAELVLATGDDSQAPPSMSFARS